MKHIEIEMSDIRLLLAFEYLLDLKAFETDEEAFFIRGGTYESSRDRGRGAAGI